MKRTVPHFRWYDEYSRQQIAAGFGEPYNKGRWDVGIVRLENATVLLVTFQKTGEDPFSPGLFVYHYGDRFLAPDLLLWQSQLSMETEGKIARRVLDFGPARLPTFLFSRPAGKRGGKTGPFTYCGTVTPLYIHGERPITAIWRLDHPLPAPIMRELCPLAGPCRQIDLDSERKSRQ